MVRFVANGRGGSQLIDDQTVFNPKKCNRLEVNYQLSVTVERCKTILQAAGELSTRDLVMISLRHSVYSKTPGNEMGDAQEDCYLDKRYD